MLYVKVSNKVACLLLLCVPLVCGNAFTSPASSSQTGETRWQPKRALLNRLASAQQVDEFEIRPPRNYTPLELGRIDGKATTAWAGPRRRNGTRPLITVLILTLSAEIAQNTPENLLLFLEGASRPRKNWTRTSPEKGMINGLTFVRARWSDTDSRLGRKMHGFNYIAIVGNKLVKLSSQDVEPYSKNSLKLAETSALTFKKR